MSHYCRPCNRSFGKQQSLEQHLASSVHNHECVECDRSFGSRHALEQHLTSSVHVVKDYIDVFFAAYPRFDYDSSRPIWTEFDRLCDDFGWCNDDDELWEARRDFKSAMVQQFNSLYGTDEEDLNAWHGLCRILNIEPIPERLNQCRRVSYPHSPVSQS